MARTVYKRLLRRPAPRLGVQQLEDRTVPALFTAQPAVAATGLNNNGCVAVGDLNKDGSPDAVLANFGFGYGALAASKITVLFGNGSGGYSKTVNISTGGKNVSYVDLGDVNGDGYLDIAAGNATTGGNQSDGSSVAILLNDQSGGFAPAVGSPVSTGGFRNLSSVDLADINADGKLDLIADHFGFDNGSSVVGQGISYYAGDGTGKFALLGTIDPTTNTNLGIEFIPTNAQAADLNGDSVVDLVCTVPAIDLSGNNDPGLDGFVYLFAGTGGGAFAAQPTTFGSGGGLPLTLTLADVDGKNGLDVLVGNAGNPNATPEFKGSAVGVLINNGGGGFAEGAVSTSERGTFAVAAADFNLDGKIDIAAANYGSQDGSVDAFVSVYYGNGNGGFVPATLDGSPFDTGYGEGGAQFLAVGDFDTNGTPDLIVAHAPNSSLQTKVVQLKNNSVAPAASATDLQSSANPTGYGTSVTFTATVSSGGSPATAGTVTFFDGSSAIGGPTAVDAQGKAAYTTSTLGVATHTITAKYSGATGIAGSTSNAVSQVVNQASTLSTLQASASTVVAGNPVTFTVSVTSGGAFPNGTVTFLDGATQIGGTFNLDAQGKASVTTSSLAAGNHTVTAVYAGNANFAGSTSNSVSVLVTNPTPPPVTPNVTLGSSANPAAFGSAVTFTATVTAASGTPTGSVTFYDGATAISGAVALAGTPSKATFTVSTLTVGTHPVTAKYAGAAGFNPADSPTVNQVINPIATTVGLATDANPATVTLAVTFTATVGATTGSPTGSVQFFDGAVAISGLTLIGAGGKATFSTGTLAVGSHNITATFVPSTSDYAGSTSPAVAQLVNKAGVTVTVTGSGPATVTEPVTLTATLVEVPIIGPDATGLVTFKLNGTTVLGSVSAAGGTAQITTTKIPVGGGTITAEYAGDGNFSAGTSPGVTQQVDKAGIAVTLTGSSTPVTVGQNVTFVATLADTPDIALNPTGQVVFKLNGTTIGTVAVSGGKAQFSTATLPVGDNTLTAEYVGDASFAAGGSAPLTQQIQPIGTTIGVGTSTVTATVTLPVTLTATVAAAIGAPAGNVQFFSGGTAVSGLIPVAGGKATYSTSALPVGASTITAQFISTDPSFAGSTSPALTQTVVKANPGITVAVDVAAAGQPSTLRASVAKPAGVTADPGGTVTFKVNGTTVGTAAVVGGLASTTTVLPAGTSSVTAEYDGDGNFSTVAATATANSGGGTAGQNPGLVGYKEFGVGAGAGRTADARFFNPDGTERFTAGSLFGGTGGVRVTSADFNNDGVADLVAGTGPGGPSNVIVLDGKTRSQLFQVNPFEASFGGGVYVTSGDVNGDGVPDLVISPDEGGGPRVRVFSGKGFGQIDDFFGIDDPGFRGGARAAVADITGDGVGELVVAAGFGGGPRVAIFDGTALGGTRRKPVPDFFVFESSLRNGAFIAAGDVDGDGKADLISGGGPGGGPRVTITSGAARLNGQETVIANFFAGNPDNRGGVRVAARDLDGDNKADLVVGAGTGAGSRVTAYTGKAIIAKSDGPAELYGFDAFPGFDGGVYVG